MNFIFREAAHLSQDFWQAVALRQQELREPLGLSLSVAEVLAEIPPQRHFVLSELGTVIGCAVAVPVDEHLSKIRQVTITSSLQGCGLGRRLMEGVETTLRASGCRQIHLHARLVVREFYERLGYAVIGPSFEEIGLPHVLMEKRL